MSSRYDRRWQKPFKVIKPTVQNSLLSENDRYVVNLIEKYARFEYHIRNWQHLPISLGKRLGVLLNDIRPPQRDTNFGQVLKTISVDVGDYIAKSTRSYMSRQQEDVMVELNFSHIQAPYLNIYSVARQHIKAKYGRKIDSAFLDECIHTALKFVSATNRVDRPSRNGTADGFNAAWNQPKHAASAKPGAASTPATTANRFQPLENASEAELDWSDLEPDADTDPQTTSTTTALPHRLPTKPRRKNDQVPGNATTDEAADNQRTPPPHNNTAAATAAAEKRRASASPQAIADDNTVNLTSSTGAPPSPVAGPSSLVVGPSSPVAGPSPPAARVSSPAAGSSSPIAAPSSSVNGDTRQPSHMEHQHRYILDPRTHRVLIAKQRLPGTKLQKNETKSPTLVIGDSNMRAWTGYPADWTVVCHGGKTIEDLVGILLRSVHMLNNVDRVVLAAGMNNRNDNATQHRTNVDLLHRLQEALNGRLFVIGVPSSDLMSAQKQANTDAVNDCLRQGAGADHYIEPVDRTETVFFEDDTHYVRRTGTQMINNVQTFFRLR
jgi:hypothetical protein